MKNLPKISKAFGRLGKTDRLRQRTVSAIKGALVAAGLLVSVGSASAMQGSLVDVSVRASANAPAVIVLTPAPPIGITDGRMLLAQHVSHSSHSSHASHTSHGSHCSGYSYC